MTIHTDDKNPATAYQHYDKPDDILNDGSLDKDQKIELLKAWAVDEEALARASAEGLSGGEQGHLKAVNDALNSLTN